MLTPKRLFDTFRRHYVEERRKNGSPLSVYYAKEERIPKQVRASDWTPVIMTLWDTLARKFGLFQLFERRLARGSYARMDGIWVRDDAPEKAIVAIEAENQPMSVFDSEVRKLVIHEAPLKVLITEHEDKYGGVAPSVWRQDYRTRVNISIRRHDVASEGDGAFVLILADEVLENPRDWWGFALARKLGRWKGRWSSLGHELR